MYVSACWLDHMIVVSLYHSHFYLYTQKKIWKTSVVGLVLAGSENSSCYIIIIISMKCWLISMVVFFNLF